MKEEERDRLLEKIATYVEQIKNTDVPDIKSHLKELNNNVAKNTVRSIRNEDAIEDIEGQVKDIKMNQWSILKTILVMLLVAATGGGITGGIIEAIKAGG